MKYSNKDVGVLRRATVMAILTDYHWGRYDLNSATEKILALDTANEGEECDCPCHEPSIYRPHKSGHSCCDKAIVIDEPTPKPSLIDRLPVPDLSRSKSAVHRDVKTAEKINELVRAINKLNQKGNR